MTTLFNTSNMGIDRMACHALECSECTGDPECPQLQAFWEANHKAQGDRVALVALWFPNNGGYSVSYEQAALFQGNAIDTQ